MSVSHSLPHGRLCHEWEVQGKKDDFRQGHLASKQSWLHVFWLWHFLSFLHLA
jgi:hypothetical protein